MSAPKEGAVRAAAVAGSFYPSDSDECRELAAELLHERESDAGKLAGKLFGKQAVGGIVPHAGWVCSGAIAGCTIRAIQLSGVAPQVVVVFGAVHSAMRLDRAALDTSERWSLPTGDAAIDTEVRQVLSLDQEMFVCDERFHEREHAVEVELPLVQAAWPDARVLPVEVPLVESAVEAGLRTARALRRSGRTAVFLASSDLTHYGPAYRFSPAGVGIEGLRWARDNNRRLLDRVERMDAMGIVAEVKANANACGGGAIAAMLAACMEFGASQSRILVHTDSHEVLSRLGQRDDRNAVGYTSAVVM